MKQSRLANRYAKALFELALEEKKLDQIGADMALISETIDENKELENMLKSPVIKLEKKEKVMRQVFGKKTNPISLRFYVIGCQKEQRRASCLFC
jgi:F-type H+-transporting ATPase subunit delta